MILNNLAMPVKFRAADKVREIITNEIHTMNDTANGAKVINEYEEKYPEEKEFIYEMRNLLCSTTFKVYAETRK